MGESGLFGENVCSDGMGGKDFPLPGVSELVTILAMPFFLTPEDGESELDGLACGCIWQCYTGTTARVPLIQLKQDTVHRANCCANR